MMMMIIIIKIKIIIIIIINSGLDLIKELGKRLTLNTGDIGETSFLFQCLSATIQRFNAVAFRGTFAENDTED